MPTVMARPLSLRLLPLGLLLLAGGVFIGLGGGRYLDFAALAQNREWLCAEVQRQGSRAALAFILGYAGVVALSVPGAALLTMTGGLLFGPWLGAIYALIGATMGATVVFVAARAGLAGLIARAGQRVARLEAGFRQDALTYLLILRLVPIFPFWLVNLVAGAAGLRLAVYVPATLIGMTPASFIFASLGSGVGGVLSEGRRPDLAALTQPDLLLPLLGLAALSSLPMLYRRWRGAQRRQSA